MPSKCINAIHEKLKKDTHKAHRDLDQSPMLLTLMSEELSEGIYGQILGAMCHWFTHAEAKIQAWIPDIGELDFLQSKSSLIDKDLSALSLASLKVAHPKVLENQVKLNIDNKYKALGLLYVVEGSTLGGMVIAPRVSKVLGRHDCTSFYECYEHYKLSYFARTMAFIQSGVSCEHQIEEVVKGALISFESLRFYLKNTEDKKAMASLV